MRDQGIIVLCTNSEQTLTPHVDGPSDGNLIAVATGNRSNESHWRVHWVDRQIRAFESVTHCGHFLQITEERTVDVMVRLNKMFASVLVVMVTSVVTILFASS